HQDGLLHISEISDNYVRHPSDILKVGDKVDVWVLSVDKDKHRIALTMIDPALRESKKAEYEKQKAERAEKKAEWEKIKAERAQKHAEWEKRQAERAERAKNPDHGREGGERRFDRRDRENGERRPFNRDRHDGDRRERRDYREHDRDYVSTENMTMEEKLAALASRFNKK
ncbi:MAG: S1 RNA-binding domain-containing protein, partial [Clostridiales bacterium]|nr:S1 RNA-binding domain-containing protein [Clostridiales bacterium]